MTESLPRSERRRVKIVLKKDHAATENAALPTAAVPARAPLTVRGQRYVAPAGRHSKQTHRRAEERAAADGHATVKEQHAHDRSLVLAEINRVAQAKAKQKQQSGGGPKVKMPEAAPTN